MPQLSRLRPIHEWKVTHGAFGTMALTFWNWWELQSDFTTRPCQASVRELSEMHTFPPAAAKQELCQRQTCAVRRLVEPIWGFRSPRRLRSVAFGPQSRSLGVNVP